MQNKTKIQTALLTIGALIFAHKVTACEPQITDLCTNLPGTQTEIPSGYVLEDGKCVKEPEDLCTNIDGIQESIPEGYTEENGICTKEPEDVCKNIEGIQTKVPAGYELKEGNCTKIPDEPEEEEEKDDNPEISIKKEVRIEGDNDWEDKITDVDFDDIVEFKLTVKNKGDVELDGIKTTDDLPDELERVGGSGLTEYFDDLEPGDKIKIIIKAKLKSDYYDSDLDCVKNKAKVEVDDDDLEDSDSAKVCYSGADIEELPETGAGPGLITIIGLATLALGFYTKKKFAYCRVKAENPNPSPRS